MSVERSFRRGDENCTRGACPPQIRNPQSAIRNSLRPRLDRDEVPGERPHAPLRNRQRPRDRHQPSFEQRTHRRPTAEPALPLPKDRSTKQAGLWSSRRNDCRIEYHHRFSARQSRAGQVRTLLSPVWQVARSNGIYPGRESVHATLGSLDVSGGSRSRLWTLAEAQKIVSWPTAIRLTPEEFFPFADRFCLAMSHCLVVDTDVHVNTNLRKTIGQIAQALVATFLLAALAPRAS